MEYAEESYNFCTVVEPFKDLLSLVLMFIIRDKIILSS